MAKAHRAPMDSYEPHLAVSEHAVLRFRERAKDFLEEGGHLSDAAVQYQVDFAVWDAMQAGDRTYEIVDSNQPSKLVHIESEAWGSLWALVRENRNPRQPQTQAVITLLTDWQMTQNALDGRYTGNVPKLPQFQKHFENAAKPKLVAAPRPPEPVPAPVPAPTASAPKVAALPPPEPKSPVAPPSPAPDPDERRLLVYPGEDGRPCCEQVERSRASERIQALCAAGKALKDIEVWKPAATRVRVEVD